MGRRFLEVEKTVDVEVSLDEIDTEDLVGELQDRKALQDPGQGRNVLQRIVWEHDVLGLPLDQVVDDLMREHGVTRNSASAAAPENA